MPLVSLSDNDYIDLGYHVTEPLDEQSATGAKAYSWIWGNEDNTKPLPKKYAKSVRRALKKAIKRTRGTSWHNHYINELETLNTYYPTLR